MPKRTGQKSLHLNNCHFVNLAIGDMGKGWEGSIMAQRQMPLTGHFVCLNLALSKRMAVISNNEYDQFIRMMKSRSDCRLDRGSKWNSMSLGPPVFE